MDGVVEKKSNMFSSHLRSGIRECARAGDPATIKEVVGNNLVRSSEIVPRVNQLNRS